MAVEKSRERIKWWWPILAAFFMFVTQPLWIGAPPPHVHPRFFAAPYVAPMGCFAKDYREGDTISITCADNKYLFDNWEKYGLEWPGRLGVESGHKFGTYYRVGNDLIGMQCGFGDCNAKAIERNVFTVK
jgi:hypothetical protein